MDSNNKYSQPWKKFFTKSETEKGHLIVHLALLITGLFIRLIHWSLVVDSPHCEPVMWNFHCLFVVSLSKLLNKPSIIKINLKISYLKLHSNLPGANELTG